MVRLNPNPDWMQKARKVTIQKIVATIEEQITYNPEGDEPSTKTNKIIQKKEVVGLKLPESGWAKQINLIFPAKELRDSDGFLPRPKQGFHLTAVNGFTTTANLYKIEYFVSIKVPSPPPVSSVFC